MLMAIGAHLHFSCYHVEHLWYCDVNESLFSLQDHVQKPIFQLDLVSQVVSG